MAREEDRQLVLESPSQCSRRMHRSLSNYDVHGGLVRSTIRTLPAMGLAPKPVLDFLRLTDDVYGW